MKGRDGNAKGHWREKGDSSTSINDLLKKELQQAVQFHVTNVWLYRLPSVNVVEAMAVPLFFFIVSCF